MEDLQKQEYAERIIDYVLREVIGRPGVEIKIDTPLVSSGLIDSLALVNILLELETVTRLRIPASKVQPKDMFPEKWRLLYGLNPMVGVIEGFRWALLGNQVPAFAPMALSVVVVTVLLLSGIVFFKRMERILADII